MRGNLIILFTLLVVSLTLVSAQYPQGNLCQEDTQCQSNNCENNVCCQGGKTCCNFDSECAADEECGSNYYCIPKPISLTPEENEVQFSPPELIEEPEFCTEGCLDQWVGDGLCDPSCDVEACNFDGGDCTHVGLGRVGDQCEANDECASGNCNNALCCPAGQICCTSSSDCPSDQSCNALNFCQSAPREQCGPECVTDWVGDGECQLECIGCDFDGGDCLMREGVALSPGEAGIEACGFQGELQNYGRCVFTVLGKTETLPGASFVTLTPYCSVAEKITTSLTESEATDLEIISAAQETIFTLSRITDHRLALTKYADIVECLDTIKPLPKRNVKKSLDAMAAAYYTQTHISATAFLSGPQVDILIQNEGKKFGVDQNSYLYKDQAGTTYKNLPNTGMKFVLVPDLRISANVYEANGVDQGDTAFTIIEARRGSKEYIEFNRVKTSEESVFRIEETYLKSDYNGDGVFEQINIRPALVEEESLSFFSRDELVRIVLPILFALIFAGIIITVYYMKKKKN